MNKFLGTSTYGDSGNSETLIDNNDSSKVYSFFSPISSSIYLFTFNSTNGNVIGSRYKSNAAWNSIFGSTQIGTKLLFSVRCSLSDLILVDTTTFVFYVRQFLGTNLYQIKIEPVVGR